ncbi:MAG TPA: hypothetical protein VMQ73_21515 [Methylomirabilota bacterium]|nr:hypothetical protein [Methylomirabilota bacterium]
MQNDAGLLVNGLRRWRERRRAETRRVAADFRLDGKDRRYELWACAMAPELVSLAALMALADDDAAATNDALSPARSRP